MAAGGKETAQASVREPSQRRILSEQTRQLFDALPNIVVVTTLAALLLVVVHLPEQSPGLLWGWFAVFVAVAGARLALWRAYRRTMPGPRSAGRWYARFRLLTVLSALLWGSSAWLFLVDSLHGHGTLLAFVIAGLGAGGVAHLGVRWQCAWLFIIPALTPFIVRYWTLDTPLAQATAMLIALYIVALLAMTVQVSRRAIGHVRARLDLAAQADLSRRQQKRFQSLVESTMAILWEGDPETFAFTYVSPEAEQILGHDPAQWTADPDFWKEHIHPEDRDWALRYCARATENLQQHAFDYRMIAADGRAVWLRDVINVVVSDGRPVKLVGVMIDISELKHAQRNLEYVSGLQSLMVEASRDFLQSGDAAFDRVLDETLGKVGRFCGVDRAYMIRFDRDLKRYTNTHEWVADGISAEKDNLQSVSTGTIPRLLAELKRGKPVALPGIAGLDEGWAAEKALFAEQQIRSLVVLPIHSGDRLLGLIGFDSVLRERDWGSDEIAVLQVLGDLIGTALERAEVARRLRASEALRAHAEALAQIGSWEWEVGSEQFHASSEWRNVTGCGNGPLSRAQALALTPADERPRVERALNSAVASGEPYSIEHRIVRPDNGEERWVRVHAEIVDAGDDRPRLRGFMQDITSQRRAERKLFELAHYDNLTGLPNRALLLDRLQQALKRSRRRGSQVAVLFLDLDQFKKVNDTLGHEAGDRALVEASRRLIGLFREQDTLARIGGDEFLVVLDEFERVADVIASTSRILEAFRKPLAVADREFTLTASIGVAVFPDDGESADELMRHADTAMYHAKKSGRDAYRFFTRSMNEVVARRIAIEESLRGAVARGEFVVAYQPVVRLRDRRIVAAEALLRWHHPELGDVSPGEFIEVAEQSGRIEELGAFVLEHALARIVQWRTRIAPDLSVSINVSPRQFRDDRLAETITGALEQAGLPGGALNIEITEGVLMPGRQDVSRTLAALRGHGVGIVMDDFGTGYASLSYLRDYPFGSLKIDHGFIRNLEADARNRKLVVSAIQLGRALEVGVVAEGVETEAQLEFLLAEGCELGQGFLFGRPMDADDLAARLAGHSAE